MDIKESRKLSLRRYYEKAKDSASLLIAISRCKIANYESLFLFRDRQKAQAVELIHDFAYSARKAIEIAELFSPGIKELSDQISLAPYGIESVEIEIAKEALPLCKQTLWWVLGRIVHSQDLIVLDQQSIEYVREPKGVPTSINYYTPVLFGVHSDFDKGNSINYLYIEQLAFSFQFLEHAFDFAFENAK